MKYDYNERDNWSDDLLAAYWRKVMAEAYLKTLPVYKASTEMIEKARLQVVETADCFQKTYERWAKNDIKR